MVRYDPYTDSFIDNPTKKITATINLDAIPKDIVQINEVVEVSDESIEKIADAVVRKLTDRKTEPNSSEKSNNSTISKMEQVDKDINVRCKEPQTIRCPKCGSSDYIKDLEKDFGVKDDTFKYKCINCNTYIKDEP